jgi:hypothetical protein
MPEGHYVFAQVMQHLPLTTFRRCIERYDGDARSSGFRASTNICLWPLRN